MDKQLRRLVMGVMIITHSMDSTSLVELCELLAGRGEEELQAEFDGRMATMERLVFPDDGYRKAFNTDRETAEAVRKADENVARVMARHRKSLAKLARSYKCRECGGDFRPCMEVRVGSGEPSLVDCGTHANCPLCAGVADAV